MNKLKNKYIMIPAIVAVLSLFAMVSINFILKDKTIKPYSSFLEDINSKIVSNVNITTSSLITVELTNGNRYKTDNPRSNDFKEKLLSSGIVVSEKPNSTPIETIPAITLGLSLITLLFMFFKSTAVSSKSMASVDALDTQMSKNNKYSFESVAGNEEAKESVKDVVDFLKNPEKYTSYGARMPRGIILYGEPGTGKTLIAKAVAGEANVPFYAMSGSDFIQIYVGVGASRVRSLFKKAKSHGKAVIFIDEIDAIGKARSSNKSGGSDERDQTLNALLTEMSGFNDNEGVVVIAATNRLDMLDPALLRPGRFDRHIEIMLPDVSAREKILNLHLKNKPIENIDTKLLAQKTAYFSGAKLESLINEAAILACKENSNLLKDSHLDKAFSIVIAGHDKLNRDSIKQGDKLITAYHEAGHALISMLVLPREKVSKVTIIPTTKGAGGYTMNIPEDNMYHSKEYLDSRIMVLLAGRAAEEITFGKKAITTGAYSDLKQSTNIINKMVTEYGMGETLGLLSINELTNINTMNTKYIIEECKQKVNTLYVEVTELLNTNKSIFDRIAKALIEKETLEYAELQSYLNLQ